MPDNHGHEDRQLPEPRLRGPRQWWTGSPAADRTAFPRLRHWHRPPRNPRRTLWVLALVLAGHALVLWLILRAPPRAPPTRHAIRVTVIEPEPAPPPLVPPPPVRKRPARPHASPPRPPIKRAPGSMTATMDNANGEPLQLYGPKGQIRLPQNGGPASSTPVYRTPAPHYSHIYNGKSPLPYQPTLFSKDWAPANQSLGAKTVGRAFDEAVEKTTVGKTITLPGGVKVHCVLSPLILVAGCPSTPPPPPPQDDNDIRLSMPPAETLTGKKVDIPSSASASVPPTSGR